MELISDKVTSNSLAMTDCAYVHRDAFQRLAAVADTRTASGALLVRIRGLAVAIRDHSSVAPNAIAFNMFQRRTLDMELNKPVMVEPFTGELERYHASTITVELDVLNKARVSGVRELNCDEVTTALRTTFLGHVYSADHMFAMKIDDLSLRVRVVGVENVDLSVAADAAHAAEFAPVHSMGQLRHDTNIVYQKSKDAPLKLVGAAGSRSNRLFERGFNFNALGIGGLDKEFADIFRRAFASRIFPADIVRKMGINHVRGMLLFGPPGCGKTLIARQIGKALNARDPKIVNGPAILDKYVGGSEAKIRELFEEAEKEQAEAGDASELHIVIFDEIDAICKKRGSTRDNTGVHDSIVNQLLSKIDGVDSLNNVLIIGMTNRKDLIDDALLRPGRLEVHVEIGLPDEAGRIQILNIHTAEMRKNGFLSPDVSIEELAARTKNFTGAEIEGLVKSASSYAFERQVDVSTLRVADPRTLRVERMDFDRSLREVVPAFGVEDDELKHFYRNGIIHYGDEFDRFRDTLRALVRQVRTSERTSLLSVLLTGPPGCGKTALTAHLGVESGFPFVKRISADDLLAMGEGGKCGAVTDTFNAAYRSPLSMVIIDDVERVLEYVRLGPRFSNAVLQTLMVLVNKEPPTVGRKLFVVATTSNPTALEDMGLTQAFNVTLPVPVLNQPAHLKQVLRESDVEMDEATMDRIASSIPEPISIKKLLLVLEMARQEVPKVEYERFMECMHACGW